MTPTRDLSCIGRYITKRSHLASTVVLSSQTYLELASFHDRLHSFLEAHAPRYASITHRSDPVVNGRSYLTDTCYAAALWRPRMLPLGPRRWVNVAVLFSLWEGLSR